MRIKASLLLAAAGAAVVSTSALADFSRDITITATYARTDNVGNPISIGGSTTASIPITLNLDRDFISQGTDAEGTQWYTYDQTQAFGDLPSSQLVPATALNPSLSHIRIGIQHDPMVVANFNVSAGIVNTTFTVTSSLLSFPSIVNGLAKASAAVTVTDSPLFGDKGQLSLSSLNSTGKLFRARFNSATPVDFANLITGGSASGPFGVTHVFTEDTGAPFLLVPGTTTDMQSEFSFALSKFDTASGVSTFQVIPAPGAAGLLGLAGLAAARRRRAC